ncbi:MAG: YigZ family protein [Bacteroidales bacterium]
MGDTYYAIDDLAEGVYREKMSKFISYAIPVETVEEVKEWLRVYQKKHFDARHLCWAYMLGAERTEYASNDNGEPSGTAGKPILGQINSHNLTNILIIVVRYFGGIKLGTSGLIVAYKQAAIEAITNANIIECHDMNELTFTFPFVSMNPVMQLIKKEKLDIVSQYFDNSCEITLSIRGDEFDRIRTTIDKIDGTSLKEG